MCNLSDNGRNGQKNGEIGEICKMGKKNGEIYKMGENGRKQAKLDENGQNGPKMVKYAKWKKWENGHCVGKWPKMGKNWRIWAKWAIMVEMGNNRLNQGNRQNGG